MTEWHPEREALERFMRGELAADGCQELVSHLLSGCEECRRIARQSFPCGEPAAPVDSRLPSRWQQESERTYQKVFESVVPRVLEAAAPLTEERAAAAGLLAELKRHPHERRLLLARNSRRFRNWPLCELILDEAFALGFADPAAAIEFASLGATVAEGVAQQRGDDPLVADLQGRAHATLANALRIAGDLGAAAEELRRADGHLTNGSGDQVERARFLEFSSNLALEHRDFTVALELLGRAIRIYRAHGESHRLGRALVSRGFLMSERGDLAAAIASLRQAIRHIDQEREPRLVLVAKHNLLMNLHQTGRYHQALRLVPETRKLHRQLGNEMDLMRFEWLQARILSDSGDLKAAEKRLRHVKQFFVQRRIAHDAALVSLDLAGIYLQQRRTGELKRLAAEMLAVFHALRIHREAIAALVLFQKAVELERVTLGLVRDLAAYLKASRNEPRLPFRPSANP